MSLPLTVLPNVLTITRIVMIIPLVFLMVQGHYGWALVLALVAGLSDVLDGFLARRFGWQTHFGGWADPAADKLLMLASYLTLGYLALLPMWLIVLVIARDVVIVCGAIIYRWLFGPFKASPTRLSKWTMVAQVALIWVCLIDLQPWPMPEVLPKALLWIVTALSAITLAQYVIIWGYRAWHRTSVDQALP